MAQVSKRTTARGEVRYDVRVRIGGRVVTRTFKRRRDADAYAHRIEVERSRGVVLDPGRARATVREISERWLEARTSKRARSVDRDGEILRKHVWPVIGTKAVGAVSRADVQALVDGWVSAGLAASTVSRQYSCLRAVFSWACAADVLDRTPCRAIQLPKVGLTDRPDIGPQQLGRLAEELGPDYATMMWVGAVLGLRWSEVAGLRVRDLDFASHAINVSMQLGRDHQLAPPKSAAGRRRISAPQWLMGDLGDVLARRRLGAADSDALIFRAPKGGPLDYSHWRFKAWAPACARAGLPGLRFHDLRSLAASALVAGGVDVKTAQARLGHSSSRLTLEIYARANAEADRRAAGVVGEWFRPRDGRAMEADPGLSD